MSSTVAESLQSIIQRGTIRVGYHTVDFESAVRGLIVSPLLEHGVSPARVDEIVDSVLEREKAGTTCAGPIALPHARISGIPKIVAGLGLNRDGIYPGGSARLILAFVSPQDAAAEHLRFLSSAAKTFRTSALLDQLLVATTNGDVIAALTT
ncbi:MAG TPA: PTS sugar transporter subunit IIA [Thermoanaerobaculia bacterium]|nr:PTS sugar transporter subunit IIA [Thermoanaerobaculia bacterium]